MNEEERKKAEERLNALLRDKRIVWPADAFVGLDVEDAAMGRSIMEERIRSEKLEKFYGGKNNMEKNVERSYNAGINLIERHFEHKLAYNADQFAEIERKFRESTQEYQLVVAFVNNLNKFIEKPTTAEHLFRTHWYSPETQAAYKQLHDDDCENVERIYQEKQKCILEYDLCETYEQRIACLEKWEIL